MVYLQLYNLPAVLLFTVLMPSFAHDSFHGYDYLPKTHIVPILAQQGYNHRNRFEVKLALPMINNFNPNVLESIVTIRSEYQPVPMVFTKQSNHINKQGILQQQDKEINIETVEEHKEINTKPTEKDFNQSKSKEIKYNSKEIEDTEGTTDYDDLSTTEDYTLDNRIAPEVVASLLG